MNTWLAVALVLPLMILGCKSEEVSDSGQEVSGCVQLVRLECSHWGRFGEGCPWELSLDADGRAKLSIDCGWPNVTSIRNSFENIERTFLVEEDRIAAIETAIGKCRFFELPAQIGDGVPDGGTRVLSIWTTNGQKTITINFLREEGFNEDVRCAIELWDLVRDCVGDEEAVDVRPYDKMLLKQVSGLGPGWGQVLTCNLRGPRRVKNSNEWIELWQLELLAIMAIGSRPYRRPSGPGAGGQ